MVMLSLPWLRWHCICGVHLLLLLLVGCAHWRASGSTLISLLVLMRVVNTHTHPSHHGGHVGGWDAHWLHSLQHCRLLLLPDRGVRAWLHHSTHTTVHRTRRLCHHHSLVVHCLIAHGGLAVCCLPPLRVHMAHRLLVNIAGVWSHHPLLLRVLGVACCGV